MSTINWNVPAVLRRSIVVEAVDYSQMEEVVTTECWKKAAEVCKLLGLPKKPISIHCEIWPDTGRIFWIISDDREFCRLELLIPDLERKYFEIASQKDFEIRYNALLSHARQIVRAGCSAMNLGFADKVTIRDSDDTSTEETIS